MLKPKEGKKKEPIMLAIGAVTFSTMHQSSLGSLYLLMPDKLSHLWWSPILPVCYFLSSIAAGIALMVLVEMWIAKGYHRNLRMSELSAMGKLEFWALLIYLAVRIGDVVVRGELNHIGGARGMDFLVEVGLMGVLPLILLSVGRLREKSQGAWLGKRAGGSWRDLEPLERSGLRHGSEGSHAAARAAALHALHHRMGHLGGDGRGNHLPLPDGRCLLPILPKETAKAAAAGD